MSDRPLTAEQDEEWGSDLDVAQWLVWFARKSKGKARDVALRAIEQHPGLRFQERLATLDAARASVPQESPREGLPTEKCHRAFGSNYCATHGAWWPLDDYNQCPAFLAADAIEALAADNPPPDAALPRGVASQPELDDLRALSDAATPGEWEFEGLTEDGWALIGDTPEPTLGTAIIERPYGYGEGVVWSREDAAFIVAAVNYVRRALAETLRSRETPDEGLRAALEDIDEAEAGVLDAIREVLPNADQRVDVLTALHPLSEAIRKGAALARSIPETRETVE